MRNETEDGGNNWNSIEASRIWEKRDKETRDAYVTSSYRSGRVREEKEVRAVCDKSSLKIATMREAEDGAQSKAYIDSVSE